MGQVGRVIRKEGDREAWNLPSPPLGFAIPFPLCSRDIVKGKNKGVFSVWICKKDSRHCVPPRDAGSMLLCKD